jgi:hypothetical protein
MFPIVDPRNATSRGPSEEPLCTPRYESKSATTACTSSPGYWAATAEPAARTADSLTSTGTYRRSVPAADSASSSSRVLSEEPEPSSTSAVAPDSAAISAARSLRIARSARVG